MMKAEQLFLGAVVIVLVILLFVGWLGFTLYPYPVSNELSRTVAIVNITNSSLYIMQVNISTEEFWGVKEQRCSCICNE